MVKSKRKIIALAVVIVLAIGLFIWNGHKTTKNKTQNVAKSSSNQQAGQTAPEASEPAPEPVNHCSANTTDQKLILIDTQARHLWACQGTNQLHDSDVVTGYDKLAETITPAGSYKIYAKTTNTTLTGSDSNGSWNRPVYYWMPFLSNQYGVYGFHDATWRANSDFGGISPESKDASHGCVELPLATAKWIYNWAPIGTAITIT